MASFSLFRQSRRSAGTHSPPGAETTTGTVAIAGGVIGAGTALVSCGAAMVSSSADALVLSGAAMALATFAIASLVLLHVIGRRCVPLSIRSAYAVMLAALALGAGAVGMSGLVRVEDQHRQSLPGSHGGVDEAR